VESGSQPAHKHTFFYGNGTTNHHLGTGFFIHIGTISAGKTIEFISNRMLYITLRGHWHDDIVLNVHVPTF